MKEDELAVKIAFYRDYVNSEHMTFFITTIIVLFDVFVVTTTQSNYTLFLLFSIVLLLLILSNYFLKIRPAIVKIEGELEKIWSLDKKK